MNTNLYIISEGDNLLWLNGQAILKTFGENVRRFRQEKGFSQEKFAADAGLGRSFYGRVERGEQNCSVLTVMKIAKVLDINAGELFPGKD